MQEPRKIVAKFNKTLLPCNPEFRWSKDGKLAGQVCVPYNMHLDAVDDQWWWKKTDWLNICPPSPGMRCASRCSFVTEQRFRSKAISNCIVWAELPIKFGFELRRSVKYRKGKAVLIEESLTKCQSQWEVDRKWLGHFDFFKKTNIKWRIKNSPHDYEIPQAQTWECRQMWVKFNNGVNKLQTKWMTEGLTDIGDWLTKGGHNQWTNKGWNEKWADSRMDDRMKN